jgi:hypothetical protein
VGLGRHGLRKASGGIVLVKKGLALEVGFFDEVPVDDGEGADTRPRHGLGEDGSQSPAAHEKDPRAPDPLLTLGPDSMEELLARVAAHELRSWAGKAADFMAS